LLIVAGGKAPAHVAIEEDNPLGLEDVEAAAEEFRKPGSFSAADASIACASIDV
jgi:hypothetical protein